MKRWFAPDFDIASLSERNRRAWAEQEAKRAANATPAEKSSGPRSQRSDTGVAPLRADARQSGRASLDVAHLLSVSCGHANPFVVVPWPPTGNSAVRHANGAHYLQAKVRDYRKVVAEKCIGRGGVHGQYRLNVHFSPPDRRKRDMDNALKSLLDALVPAGFIPADDMGHMRELWVTVDDKKLGTVAVEAVPLGREAA